MTLDEMIEELVEVRDRMRVPGFTPVLIQTVDILPGGDELVQVDGAIARVVYDRGFVLLKDANR